jgi:2-polyprenyl-3-methyl-5-hydroxy-6-metoxy-1,4-benzoquinol methylase
MGETLRERLDAFIKQVIAADEVAAALAQFGRSDGSFLLETYTNEAHVGLDLIAPLLKPGMRVLEVGCGIGLLARFLADQGIDVVAIEPGAAGFGFMPVMGAAILAIEPAHPPGRWVAIGAEALSPKQFGQFDLIFSTNVVEHIPELESAFVGMASVLAPQGQMVHMCPNYFVPFEPHFGIPLIPGAPRATRHLAPSVLSRYPGLWDELNFITSGRVKALAKSNRLELTFDRGIIAQMIHRFDNDPTFRNRQSVIVLMIQRIIKRLGLLALAERLPGEYATPMVFRMERQHREPLP